MSRGLDQKTINVKQETYVKLLRRKKHPRQSFNEVIEGLILNEKR